MKVLFSYNIVFYYLLLFNFISKLRISMYNQTIVTIREKPPNHSKYFGALSENWSIKSKSITKLKAAIAITIKLKPIPIGLLEKIPGIVIWKKLNTN